MVTYTPAQPVIIPIHLMLNIYNSNAIGWFLPFGSVVMMFIR
jgi:hypothetical protein